MVVQNTTVGTPSDGSITSAKLSGDLVTPGALTVTTDLAVDTDTLYVDATNNRVGIGSSSPGVTLDVNGGSTTQLRLTAADSTSASIINFGDQDNVAVGRIIYSHVNDSFSFKTNNVNDRLILDSSGNFLVGTTDNQPFNNTSGTGFAVAHDGYFSVTRNGAVAYLNRNTSDGDIIDLRKNGTTVGIIGSKYSDLTVGNSDTAVRFADEENALLPFSFGTNLDIDNAISLGDSSRRFKDLYLSGGAYLGGTGSANKLDDYEEGTWTPSLNYGTATFSGASYVKIGNVVTLRAKISSITDRTTADRLRVQGLPFSAGATDTAATLGFVAQEISNIGPITGAYFPSSTDITFYNTSSAGFRALNHNDFNNASAQIYFSITYITS
jgi:hypothetical protein